MSDTSTNFERSTVQFESEPVPDAIACYPGIREALTMVREVPGAVIAGGALVSAAFNRFRGSTAMAIKDVDVFFYKPEAPEQLAKLLRSAGYRLGSKQVTNCRDFVKPGLPPVQLVETGIFNDPVHILDGFDIVACQLATDGAMLWSHPEAAADIRNLLVNFHRVHPTPKSTLEHLMRYMDKGFMPTPETIKKLCVACANTGLEGLEL